MKKTAVLLLAGALCAALLSGCGKKEETAEPEISLAAVENGDNVSFCVNLRINFRTFVETKMR